MLPRTIFNGIEIAVEKQLLLIWIIWSLKFLNHLMFDLIIQKCKYQTNANKWNEQFCLHCLLICSINDLEITLHYSFKKSILSENWKYRIDLIERLTWSINKTKQQNKTIISNVVKNAK
jgi:hypothetical protein